MRPSKPGGFLMFPLLFLAAGCGLSDYEKHVDETSVALKRFDEENKALGDPLELPMIMDKKTGSRSALPVDFYLRPQKGTKPQPAGGPFQPQDFALFRYPGPAGFNVLVAASKVAKDVKDAKAKDPKVKKVGMTTKEFQQKVRQALAEFYAKEFKKPSPLSLAEKTDRIEVTVFSAKGPPTKRVFENQILTDDPDPVKNKPAGPDKSRDDYHDFRLFFYQTGFDQAAIIYQIPAARRAENDVNLAVDYSIRTLTLGLDSLNKRVEFRKRQR